MQSSSSLPNASAAVVPTMIRNVIALLASEVMGRVAIFGIYALVARYLGAQAFGQLSLALTNLYAFQVLASAGLRTLIVREVSKDRTQTRLYIRNGLVLVALCSAVSILLTLVLSAVSGFSAETTRVVLILSLTLIPTAMSVIFESVLRAWEQMTWITAINVPANVLRVVLVWGALAMGQGMVAVAVILLAVASASCVGGYWAVRTCCLNRLPQDTNPTIQPALIWQLVKQVRAFIGVDLIIAFTTSLVYMFISSTTGEAELGFFNAATQLMSIAVTLAITIVSAVFPRLCRDAANGSNSLKHTSGLLMGTQMFVMLPLTFGLFFSAEIVLTTIQGPEFIRAAAVLRIIVWSLIGIGINNVLGHALFASGHEKSVLKIVVIGSVLTGVLTVVLVRSYGLVGAAIASLVGQVINTALHAWFARAVLSRVAWFRYIQLPVFSVVIIDRKSVV